MKNLDLLYKINCEIKLKPELLKQQSMIFNNKSIKYFTYPGVFSYKRTDKGTLLLAKKLPDTINPEKILDLGCGSGILSILASTKYKKAKIYATDIDPRAIALAKLNSKEYPNIKIYLSNLLEQINIYDFDLIISNIPAKPPKELYREMINQIHEHLAANQYLYLVATGHLGNYFKRVLKPKFINIKKIARTKKHVVLRAQNTNSPTPP